VGVAVIIRMISVPRSLRAPVARTWGQVPAAGRLLNPLVSLSDLMAFGPARYVIDGVGARPPSARVQAGEGANRAHSR